MAATKSEKELTIKQLEKKKLSDLHKKYSEDRKNIIEEFNLMKSYGKYKIFVFHHAKIIHLSFSCDDFWSRYCNFKLADKNLLEQLLKLHPPEPIYYHKSTFTGIYREGDTSIKDTGKTELIFPIYLETSKDYKNNLIKINWKTKSHNITVELNRSKTNFQKINPFFEINYSGGHTITYFPYREDLDIMEYIL